MKLVLVNPYSLDIKTTFRNFGTSQVRQKTGVQYSQFSPKKQRNGHQKKIKWTPEEKKGNFQRLDTKLVRGPCSALLECALWKNVMWNTRLPYPSHTRYPHPRFILTAALSVWQLFSLPFHADPFNVPSRGAFSLLRAPARP